MLPKKKNPKAGPPSYKGLGLKKKDRIPLWPTQTKDHLAGSPMFKSPGFAGRDSLVGRLKNLKTKDLAFIAAGLSVLIMAPLAEYIVSSSPDDSGTLRRGFDEKGALFPDGTSLYEDGIMGIAPGGRPGQDFDIITPLNVRDPSSLIMSPGGRPAAVAKPVTGVPKSPSSGWKDAIAAAKKGVKKAVKKAKGLPRPSAKLKGALKDWRSTLSGASRGGGPSMKLSAPDSRNLFGKPRVQNGLVRGPGRRDYRIISGGGSGPGAYGGGGRYGNGSTSGGSAASVLSGGGYPGYGGTGYGRGGPGEGKPGKNPGRNSAKDSRSLGESLEFLRLKMEQEKAIDLKWAKKKYDELERKKMIEQTALQTAQQAFMKVLEKVLKGPEKKEGGGEGGGPTGGEKPKEPEKESTGVPATIVRPIARAKAVEEARNSKDGEAKAGASIKAARNQVDSLSGDALGEIQKAMGNVSNKPGDPGRMIYDALGDAQKAVADAKKNLVDNGFNNVKARLKEIQKVNAHIAKSLPKIKDGVTAEKDTLKNSTTELGGLKTSKEGSGKDYKEIYDPKKGGDTIEAPLTKVKAITANPLTSDINASETKPLQSDSEVNALEAAKAKIGQAYEKIQGSPMADQMAGLGALKAKAIEAIDISITNVGQATSGVNNMLSQLAKGEGKASEAKTAHNAADKALNDGKAKITKAGTDSIAAVKGWKGTKKEVKDGKTIVDNPGPNTKKEAAEKLVQAEEKPMSAIEKALRDARKKFGGGGQ